MEKHSSSDDTRGLREYRGTFSSNCVGRQSEVSPRQTLNGEIDYATFLS